MLFQEFGHRAEIIVVPLRAEGNLRTGRKVVFRQNAGEHAVHSAGIAERHRPRGVAVVAAPERGEPAAFRPSRGDLVLDGELGGAFDSDRSGVGEKNLVDAGRRAPGQEFRQPDGRFMGESGEHDLHDFFALAADRFDDFRMVVPVAHAPPA